MKLWSCAGCRMGRGLTRCAREASKMAPLPRDVANPGRLAKVLGRLDQFQAHSRRVVSNKPAGGNSNDQFSPEQASFPGPQIQHRHPLDAASHLDAALGKPQHKTAPIAVIEEPVGVPRRRYRADIGLRRCNRMGSDCACSQCDAQQERRAPEKVHAVPRTAAIHRPWQTAVP